MTELKRIKEIDIVKALGIILIVIEHADGPKEHFIYLFHVAAFFIASGFVFKSNDTDTAKGVFNAILKKIRHLWLPYFAYTTLFTLLHNFFIKINVYTTNPQIAEYSTGRYTTVAPLALTQMIKNIASGLIFRNDTILGGAFWFVHILFYICVLYAIVDYIAKKISAKHAGLIQLTVSVALLLLGYAYERYAVIGKGIVTGMDIGRVASYYILYFMGHILAKYKDKYLSWDYKKYLCTFLASFGILLIMSRLGSIELSRNEYENPLFLLICSFGGWCLLYSTAYFIGKVKFLQGIFTFIGKRTLTILALHLLCFKVISAIIAHIYGFPAFSIAAYPVLCDKVGLWWLAYTAAGVGLPVLLDVTAAYLRGVIYKNQKLGEKR